MYKKDSALNKVYWLYAIKAKQSKAKQTKPNQIEL